MEKIKAPKESNAAPWTAEEETALAKAIQKFSGTPEYVSLSELENFSSTHCASYSFPIATLYLHIFMPCSKWNNISEFIQAACKTPKKDIKELIRKTKEAEMGLHTKR